MNNTNKYKNVSTNNYSLKLSPMREIEFIDPVTGLLPKNVNELIKSKLESRSATKDTVSKASRRKNDKFGLTLRPMPELAFIDPVTGALPKNYKEHIPQNKGKLSNCNSESSKYSSSLGNMIKLQSESKTESHKPKSKEVGFDVFQTNKPRLSRTGSTSYESKGARKVLFKDTSQSSKSKDIKSGILRTQKAGSTNTDESVLLNMEETEKEILVPKPKPKSTAMNVVKSRITPVRRKSNCRSSSSSLEEFLRLEQKLKTPRSIIKQKTKRQDFKLSTHINDIMRKLSDNKKLYEEFKTRIEINNKEINDNFQKILDYMKNNVNNASCDNLKNCNSFSAQSIDENAPTVVLNTCILSKNLRVATLQRNLEKKVIFDLNENDDCGNGNKNQQTTSKVLVAQTPNTMFRNVTQTAREQLAKLEDTPKSTFNKFA